MTKIIKMKSNKVGKIERKNVYPTQEDAKRLLEKGDTFGDSLIGMLSLVATDLEGIGAATIGLAKALASLKNVAMRTDVKIENLFNNELAHYEKLFNELTKAEKN